MSEPVGYLLTWTCYGTHLHGDSRGSVDRDHNTPGAAFVPTDTERMLRTMREMKHDAVRLDQSARDLVRRVVSDHCAHRAWSLHVCHVRTNHVHVVLSCDAHPADAMRQLKAWTTRRLRETQQKPPRATVWTEGGSRRWLWDIDSLKRAIRYVEDAQGGELR